MRMTDSSARAVDVAISLKEVAAVLVLTALLKQ